MLVYYLKNANTIFNEHQKIDKYKSKNPKNVIIKQGNKDRVKEQKPNNQNKTLPNAGSTKMRRLISSRDSSSNQELKEQIIQ